MSANQNTEDELRKRQQQQSPSAARSSSLGERSAPVAEQQPPFRSVAINPLTQHKRTLHFEPPLRRVDPGGLKQLEPRGYGRPQREASDPQLTSKLPRKPSPVRSKSLSALVREWYVDHAKLVSRPDDLPPLPRTSRVVHGAEADAISRRISAALQSRSIKTKYSKKVDSVAKCRNRDFCQFTIRLYSGEEGGVLVEVQRLCGDAVSFMRDCRVILNAAEGKERGESDEDEKPMYLRLPVSQMEFFKKVSLPPISQEEQADTINVTADLLSSHQSDTNMLGMESLAIQTDPLKTLKSTAIMASCRILCPDDAGNKKFNIHNYVMSLLIFNDDEPSPTPTLEETALEDYSTKLRNLAMLALCNALTLLAAEKQLLSVINQEWYASVLIPKLLPYLSKAENNPHDACYALRCLSTLADAHVEFSTKMRESGAHSAMEKAQKFGMEEFALLAHDAKSCLNILSCCV